MFGLQSIGQTLTRDLSRPGPAEAQRNKRRFHRPYRLGAWPRPRSSPIARHPVRWRRSRGLSRYLITIGLLRAGFVAMVFGTIAEVVLVYHRILDRARFFLAYSMITLIATVGLNIWFIGFLNLGVWGFVSSKLDRVRRQAASVPAWRMRFREVGVAWVGRHARAMAIFGAPLVLSSIGYYAIHFSDRLFLAHISKADVGIYSMAYNFAFLLSVLVGDSFSKTWDVSFYSFAENAGWQARFVRIGTWLFYRPGRRRHRHFAAGAGHADPAACRHAYIPPLSDAAAAPGRLFLPRNRRLLPQYPADRHGLRPGRAHRALPAPSSTCCSTTC